mmetsp:Transcript_65495/g.142146  ORF Transcript_65495/g.142146 Transcript_65495/m.142146 type:complete len:119 (-) Transcript_65495:268-624(-)
MSAWEELLAQEMSHSQRLQRTGREGKGNRIRKRNSKENITGGGPVLGFLSSGDDVADVVDVVDVVVVVDVVDVADAVDAALAVGAVAADVAGAADSVDVEGAAVEAAGVAVDVAVVVD